MKHDNFTAILLPIFYFWDSNRKNQKKIHNEEKIENFFLFLSTARLIFCLLGLLETENSMLNTNDFLKKKSIARRVAAAVGINFYIFLD